MNITMKINNTQNPETSSSSPTVKCAARGAALALFLGLASTCPAISTHTTDFIADATRTYFNGFEGMPAVANAGPTYTENSIRVDQVNGRANNVWTTWLAWGAQGSRAWYPNGGDFGYTRITLSDGSDFGDIGFLRGSGGAFIALFYELYENGSLVASSVTSHGFNAQYLGFSGGGFDEIRLRDSQSFLDSVGSGTLNNLAIDSIEVRQGAGPLPSVPDGGSTLALMGCALTGLGLLRRRCRA